MPNIRTTIEPDRVIEVSDSDLLDLQRQNLVREVVKDEPPAKAKSEKAAG